MRATDLDCHDGGVVSTGDIGMEANDLCSSVQAVKAHAHHVSLHACTDTKHRHTQIRKHMRHAGRYADKPTSEHVESVSIYRIFPSIDTALLLSL